MFKQHLEMIGRNETPAKKAKFWQSYVRSLKGNKLLWSCKIITRMRNVFSLYIAIIKLNIYIYGQDPMISELTMHQKQVDHGDLIILQLSKVSMMNQQQHQKE